ncbi:MAG TPA: hypothetical protein VJT49_34495 [Amycolatopsis sp.]|uniref:hypothetical protein n=1 Tax=Amycolatopsis sp. TaxID=37632 RepID=UPI002B48B02D|nr:hypothetical protein [Amycolatopsis sp.]HKS50130.1 hypothetical protein [Amycolatopsis sp.]
MTLAYVLGGLNDGSGLGLDLYEKYSRVRNSFAEMATWTGVDPRELIGVPLSAADSLNGLGQYRQAALVFAIADVLRDHGIEPSAVGGLSLGSFIGAALSGAVERSDLLSLLLRRREMPDPDPGERRQGIALMLLEPQMRLGELCRDRPGLYPAVDMGPLATENGRLGVISGYRDALEALAAELPGETVNIIGDRDDAPHSPLQQPLADFLAPHIAAMPFSDPRIPVSSCLEAKVLTTAGEIKDVFRRIITSPVSAVHLQDGLQRTGTELGLVLGPAPADRFVHWPFPVVHVETTDDLTIALESIMDIGIDPLPVKRP